LVIKEGNRETEQTIAAAKALNDQKLPDNWRKITEEEFVQGKWRLYAHSATEVFTQFNRSEYRERKISDKWNEPPEGDVPFSAHCWIFYDGTGVAMAPYYWRGKMFYFAFGCEHETRELSRDECFNRNIYHGGRCWHVTECVKCGHVEGYDTSG
jgi:hypothetical protein